MYCQSLISVGILLLFCVNWGTTSAFVVGSLKRSVLHYKGASVALKSSSNCAAHDNDEELEDVFGNEGVASRREMLIGSAGMALSSLLLLTDKAKAVEPSTYVITGANSGIGFDAAFRMAQRGDGSTIVLACRTLAKAEDASNRIQAALAGSTTNVQLIPAECDLASIASIDKFCSSLGDTMSVDVLCCNAGVARNTAATDVLRTQDGLEYTVGINHFGHFYLTNKLLPKIKRRIVVTASGVHDPESPGGAQGEKATLGNLKGLIDNGRNFEMVDGQPFNADKAYKDSKLCNVLFARELQRRLNSSNSPIKVHAFNPGLIVSTGLFRDQNPVFTKIFDFAATDLLKVGESVSWGGGCLDYLATSNDASLGKEGSYYSSAPGSSKYGDAGYGNQFNVTPVSKEAQDNEKAKKLWELSEKIMNLA